ncbi:MAG: efflux RND transporter periplasmic adaptor subunit [Gallionellaceae bacterium]|nr:efflux RND transporter periplasmic adaptor subunit [Gallionellaceae bacterium]
MINRYLPLFLLPALLMGCGKETPPVEAPKATIQNDRITFAGGASQLPGLKVEAATPAGPSEASVAGRLVWDEEHTVRVFSPLAGRVTAIQAQVGDRVRAGAPLARLQAGEVGGLQADLQRAQAERERARKQAARTQELVEHGVSPSKDLESAQADLALAEADHARASHRLGALGAGSHEVDEGLVLRSSIAGTVVERRINPGQEVRADMDKPLFVVTDPTTLWLQLDVPEGDIGTFQVGQKAEFTVSAWPGQRFQARIIQVADFVDPDKRTLTVRARVDNHERKLKGEMFASGLVSKPASGGVEVPDAAVILIGRKQYVFVEAGNGGFQRRLVDGEVRNGKRTLIREGLQAGEKVVTEGTLLLQQMLESK